MSDVAVLGHLNLLEFCREQTRWSETGSLQESDGILLCASGSAMPVLLNTAFRLHDGVDSTLVLRRADAFFGALGRGYTVMVRDDPVDDDLRTACEGTGFVAFSPAPGSPEMACRARLAEVEGFDVRPVAGAATVADFVAVNGEAYATYGMPPEEVARTISDPGRFLAAAHLRSVVAYDDDAPVAAATVLFSHGIAGIYWVGTVERARGRGFGEAVTRSVTNLAFDLGARVCTLQASPMGAPVYRRMGYETLYHYTSWVRLEAA